jgi:hypothetical protein
MDKCVDVLIYRKRCKSRDLIDAAETRTREIGAIPSSNNGAMIF